MAENPRNVRNFWATARADGRSTPVALGPSGRTGGMEVKVQQRDAGKVTTAISVECFGREDGTLVLNVRDGRGKFIHQHITQRDSE